MRKPFTRFCENSKLQSYSWTPAKTPCIRVEYDLDFAGGNYSGVGSFAYIPLKDIGHAPDAVEAAFEKLTGHDRIHIVHYCPDETFDENGKPWQPALETQQ